MSSETPSAYVAAGDNDGDIRLASMNLESNSSLGSQQKKKKKFVLKNVLKDDTLAAARMHTVGTVVKDEKQRENTDGYAMDSSNPCGMMENMDASSMTPSLTIMEGGSLGAAVFGIVKGTVGPAILYLPRGFQVSGYAVAIPSMLIATALYVYNAHRLLECWKVERDRDLELAKQGAVSDAEGNLMAPQSAPAFLTYPELAKRTWGDGSKLVEFGIAALQFGVCLTYLIFVPQNLIESAEALFGITIPKLYFLVAMVLVEIPLSWIRDIRKLTPTNVVATALIVYGLFFVLVLAFVNGMNFGDDDNGPIFMDNLRSLPAITDSWFLFVGTSFFMMEGSITLLVPLQEAVIKEEDKARFAYMNQSVTTMIVIFYILFSIVCCAAFGDTIQTALTASLNGMLATSIQLAYSLAVIFTFPLQAFPAMEVVKQQVLGPEPQMNTSESPTFKNYYRNRNILAAIVICGLGVLAYCAIDYLGRVVSILGSLFGIPLALVFPPLMHNTLVTDSSLTMRRMNKGVVVVGFLAMIAASFATLISWNDGGGHGGR